MLVFCLFTMWAQIAWLLIYFSDSPGVTSLVAVFILLTGGLLFCLFIHFFYPIMFEKSQSTPDWLISMAQSLARQLTVPVPQVHILRATGLNAFAMDDLTRHGHVLFHYEVLGSLTHEEVEAVLAHEMCHVAKGHAGVLSFMQGVMLPVTLPLALLISLTSCFVSGFSRFKKSILLANSFLSLVCFPFTSVVLFMFSRSWEYQADAGAAQLVGKQQYLQALKCLHGSFFQHPNLLGPLNSAAKNAQDGGLTHPSLARRINALQEIDS